MKQVADVRSRRKARAVFRGSQVIYGERRHLEEVLGSVERANLPARRKQQEIRMLKILIRSRTDELNSINPAWDGKFAKAGNPKTKQAELLRLAANLPREDFLLARMLADHPAASAGLLESLASHPYSAVRESVARHPRTPAATLRALAEDRREPLWFLVGCNPSAPPELRDQFRAKIRQKGQG